MKTNKNKRTKKASAVKGPHKSEYLLRDSEKIEYGKVEVDLKDIQPGEAKIRVTSWIDEDVIAELKKRGEALGIGYQTMMNKHLRETLLGEDARDMLSRIEKIERKLFGKTGG